MYSYYLKQSFIVLLIVAIIIACVFLALLTTGSRSILGFQQQCMSGNIRVVLYGDSITQGQAAAGNPLQTELNTLPDNNHYEVIIKGFPGENSFSPNRDFDKEVLSLNPQVVLLWWGMNTSGNTVAQTQTYTRMITKMKERGILPVILTEVPVCGKPYKDTRANSVITNCPGRGFSSLSLSSSTQRNIAANAEIMAAADRKLAEKLDVGMIDVRSFMQNDYMQMGCCNPWFNVGDGVHPNTLAHQEIAKFIAEEFTTLSCGIYK